MRSPNSRNGSIPRCARASEALDAALRLDHPLPVVLSTRILLAALAAAPLPIAVLRSPEASDLVRRVRAQLVDTVWRLQVGPARGSVAAPLDADLDLGRAAAAAAVIEVAGARAGLLVRLTDVASGRAYVRSVASLDADGSGPATEEAAAVLIRDSLKALADTGALDWRVEAERPQWRWELGLLGCGSVDGLTFAPSAGLYLGLARRGWVGAVGGALGLPRDRTLEGVALRLQRHVVRLTIGRRFVAMDPLFVEVAPSAGLALHHRATLAAEGGVAAEPQVVAAGLVGVAGRAGVRLGRVRFWLAGGVDAVLGAPALEVSKNGEPMEIDRGWPVAPWITVGWSVDHEPTSRSRDPDPVPAPSMSSGTRRVRP